MSWSHKGLACLLRGPASLGRDSLKKRKWQMVLIKPRLKEFSFFMSLSTHYFIVDKIDCCGGYANFKD